MTEIVGHFIPNKAKMTIFKYLKSMKEGNVIERVETSRGNYRMQVEDFLAPIHCPSYETDQKDVEQFLAGRVSHSRKPK